MLQRYFEARHGWLGNEYGDGAPFFHVQLFGRDFVPLFLIGHPDELNDDAQETLTAIRSLGLVVSVFHPAWYGFGAAEVRAFHPSTVRWICSQDRDVQSRVRRSRLTFEPE